MMMMEHLRILPVVLLGMTWDRRAGGTKNEGRYLGQTALDGEEAYGGGDGGGGDNDDK